MKYSFESLFAKRINAFIEQKNSIGYPYTESTRILAVFDRFCIDFFPREKHLTKELCLAWAVRKESESNNTFRNRLMPVREFARYLNRCGECAYVLPPDFAKKDNRYIPHIYSEAEIAAIWNVIDRIEPKKNFPIRHYVIPTFIKLLYCCGLRPCEARRIKRRDVDLKKGCLHIEESKGHKSRIVMMSDDVTEMCRKYDSTVAVIMPKRELFFPSSEGTMYTKVWIDKTFRIVKAKAGITGNGRNTPRLYDFRHTFATHCLYRWMSEGRDINAMLPYLSSYMGHEQLSDTFYYIHLVPGLFEKISGFDMSSSEELIPEVDSYE